MFNPGGERVRYKVVLTEEQTKILEEGDYIEVEAVIKEILDQIKKQKRR